MNSISQKVRATQAAARERHFSAIVQSESAIGNSLKGVDGADLDRKGFETEIL
nr:hypothetical protein [Paraburkholderia sp. BL8N3]